MPRTRQSPSVKAYKTLGIPVMAPARVGRPPKKRITKVKAKDLEDATITPVANGWLVTSSSTGKNMFVFEDMDKMFDFIRTTLKPTNEQAAVLSSI